LTSVRRKKPAAKAKRTVPCPSRFADVLQIVNSVPVDFDFDARLDDQGKSAMQIMQGIIRELPLKEYGGFHGYTMTATKLLGIKNPITGAKREDGAVCLARCRDLADARKMLRVVANAYSKALKWDLHSRPGMIEVFMAHELRAPRSWIKRDVHLALDAQAGITLQSSDLFNVIEGIDATRVRQCPQCGLLFWAGRIDQPACSKKCVNAWRNKRWRARYKQNYIQQRCGKAEKKEKRHERRTAQTP
jgi:hypothetical protein